MKPLVVDLDGTLLKSDLLIESFTAYLGASPLSALRNVMALRQGKAQLKSVIAANVDIDPAILPYDEDVIRHINAARAEGRSIYLASASNEKFVRTIASYLGLFDGWFASDSKNNLSGPAKAQKLVERFGRNGFGYIGNDSADLEVWREANESLAVRPTAGVLKKLHSIDRNSTVIAPRGTSWSEWLRLLRTHQYAKNLLVFVPLLTAHRFDIQSILAAIVAFAAFSLCASGVYILNDLIDLEADRRHPTKSKRPLASGTVPITTAAALAPALLIMPFLLAACVSLPFLAVLAGYLALTTAYTLYLKRKMMIDVVALAMLYTVRVVAGGAALDIVISEWLLAFSMFLFTSLALIKRYVELAKYLNSGRQGPENRNYQIADLSVVPSLAAAAGFNAITVFALYVASSDVHRLYAHPERLWLICPILLYWVGRALMLAQRGLMDDDPVIFALRDRNSLIAAGMIAAIAVSAMF